MEIEMLVDPLRHPLRPAGTVAQLGPTVVIAPHPDDETLGCGGLISLLAAATRPVDVIVITDGSQSHRQSRSYPPWRLAAVREQETISALSVLGLPRDRIHFLRYPDCGVPEAGTAAFEEAADRLAAALNAIPFDTLVVPWRRDPHIDHVGSWRLTAAASRRLRIIPRWLEYPIWAWTQAQSTAAPGSADGQAWLLDISSVLPRKLDAIAEYSSQLGTLIDDDPTGFVLDAAVLRQFHQPWELFIEPLP